MPATAVSPIVTAVSSLREAAAGLPGVEIATSLLRVLAAVPDPRRPQGRRHSLSAVLGLVICAVLADADNYCQITAWIHDSDDDTRAALGAGAALPSEATVRRVVQALDADAFDVATCTWINDQLRRRAAAQAASEQRRRAHRVLAVDGKTLRGSATAHTPGRHLLAVLDASTGIVCAQVEVGAKTNEITHFAGVLDTVDLTGTVVTADAMHAQRAHADYLAQRGGHYLLTVKRNQPGLHDQLTALPWGRVPIQASSHDRGHGRSEERHVKAIDLPPKRPGHRRGGVTFPHARQAVRVVRRRTEHATGATSVEVVYAVTSLTAIEASVQDLADHLRGHWGIENRLHWIRDETFAEDRCRARTGNGPRVLAGVRNLVLGLLRLAGHTNIAAARAHLARRPDRPLRLLEEINSGE